MNGNCKVLNRRQESDPCAREESGGLRREIVQRLAGTLGLPAGQLESEISGGRKIMDIAGEKGVPLDQMVDAVTRVVGGSLDREVAEGDLSPGQALSIRKEIAEYAAWQFGNGCMWLQRDHAWRH